MDHVMTLEKYQKRIDSCRTQKELLTLIENTKYNNRHDLAAIAETFLLKRFSASISNSAKNIISKSHISYESLKDYYRNHPQLSRDQIEFLAHYGIHEYKLLNATGMPRWYYMDLMKTEDYDIAYGTSACNDSGHTLRSKAGHCIQCNPKNLSFQNRYRAPGEVYVAESGRGSKIIKIGSGISSVQRLSGLNSEKYAGRSDWTIRHFHGVRNMGLVEFEIHADLSRFAINDMYYIKNNERTLCREIFNCPAKDAIDSMMKIVSMHINR